MSASWLSQLPHQIPFRGASAVTRRDDTSIEGVFVCTANDFLTPELMLVEAMAQFAGGLSFESAQHGYLTGIDRCEVLRALEPGDRVEIVMTREADFGGIFRFGGIARIDGVEVARGRFYLAAPPSDAQT